MDGESIRVTRSVVLPLGGGSAPVLAFERPRRAARAEDQRLASRRSSTSRVLERAHEPQKRRVVARAGPVLRAVAQDERSQAPEPRARRRAPRRAASAGAQSRAPPGGDHEADRSLPGTARLEEKRRRSRTKRLRRDLGAGRLQPVSRSGRLAVYDLKSMAPISVTLARRDPPASRRRPGRRARRLFLRAARERARSPPRRGAADRRRPARHRLRRLHDPRRPARRTPQDAEQTSPRVRPRPARSTTTRRSIRSCDLTGLGPSSRSSGGSTTRSSAVRAGRVAAQRVRAA